MNPRSLEGVGTVAVGLVVAAAFTWPAVLFPADQVLSRGFDGTGMLWMGHHMAHHFTAEGLTSVGTGLPGGEALQGNDGWLWLMACWAAPSLATPTGYHLWAWLGCAATFWAAERMAARGFGATWPWSLAAGLVFACNGVSAAALAEGRIYHLALWPLPLFFWGWKRFLDGHPTGPGLGLAWVACLLTTVYAAILALVGALFLLAFRPGALRRAQDLLPALVLALPVGMLFAWVFLQARGTPAWDTPAVPNLRNAATPYGWLGWSPGAGALPGFASPTVGMASVALSLVSVRLLPASTWRPLLWGAVGAAALSLGYHTHVSPFHETLWPTPLGLAWEAWPALHFLRFPVRFLLLAHLALGTLAALSLSILARRSTGPGAPWRPWALGALVLALPVDAFFWSTPVGWPRTQPAPEAGVQVRAPEGPLLDLLPDTPARMDYDLVVLVHQACGAQVLHHRPITEWCLPPVSNASPAARHRAALLPWLMEDPQKAVTYLRSHDIQSVVLHPDLFSRADAEALERGLEVVGREVASGMSGGQYLRLYEVGGRP